MVICGSAVSSVWSLCYDPRNKLALLRVDYYINMSDDVVIICVKDCGRGDTILKVRLWHCQHDSKNAIETIMTHFSECDCGYGDTILSIA